jgi:hypothetical protein
MYALGCLSPHIPDDHRVDRVRTRRGCELSFQHALPSAQRNANAMIDHLQVTAWAFGNSWTVQNEVKKALVR